MRIIKKLLTLLPLLALLPVAQVLAVSLGDELILSRLGDPVEVEIEVLQWEDLDLARVQIAAASQEEYEVFDLTWLPVLEELRFNVIGPDLDGDVRVLVSSRTPLNEPFLELLLVLRWPGGSLRREYVLLFDPPEAATPVVQTPAVSIPAPEPTPVIQEPEPVAEPEIPVAAPVSEVQQPVVSEPVVVVSTPEPAIPAVTIPVTRPLPVPAAPVPPVLPAPVEAEEITPDARTQVAIEVEVLAPQTPVPEVLNTTRRTYQVRSGSSLWNIARQFRPAGAGENLYQMLLSLHNLNRNAFINGNISLLKANAVLQIPTTDDINRIDPLTAEAEFNRRWDEGTQRFDAAQRGEPIPLFANNAPAEEFDVNDADDNLPPGTEAPATRDGENDLIMVSQTNVPRPLQITDESVDAADPTQAAATAAPLPAMPVPAPVVIQIETTTTQQTTVATAEPLSPGIGQTPVQAGVIVRQTVQTRGEITTELETELSAMRARRQSAEAIASQLNTTLQKAQAEQAARDSLLGPDNLLLVVSAMALFAALLASIVFSLKVAGDLRLRRMTSGGAMLERQGGGPSWFAAERQSPHAGRKEPHLPDVDVVEFQLQMENAVVTPVTPASPAPTPASGAARAPVSRDLFARMDGLLADDDANSGKNA